ncbi:DUF6056 family protein [Pseudomonas citronellolis]|uniref:DUF6056 family protein n=1 Tax=Pseudomonas citronellolis TaxID=53408 RepID=UPI000ABE8E58|nr:DUF6056 family protein [Pseudomonas citronellolis]
MNERGAINKASSFCGAIAVIFYLAIFSITPLMGEDYGLSRRFTQEGIIDRLTWAFHRSHEQITNWNARLGEQIAIFSLSLPEIFFIISAGITFISLFFILSLLIDDNFKSDLTLKSGVSFSLVFFLWPGMEVFFWKTANAGYLQPMALTFLILFPWLHRPVLIKISQSFSLLFIYSILCLLVGLSFENVPIAVALTMFVIFLLYEKDKRRLIIPILSVTCGWIILLTAPSTIYRVQYYRTALKSPDISLDYLIERAIEVCTVFFQTSWLIFSLALISVIYLGAIKRINLRISIIIISSILVVGSMCTSPYTEARGFLYAWCVMYSVICTATYQLIKKSQSSQPIILFLYFVSVCYATNTFSIYKNHAARLNARTNYIIDHIGREPCISGVKIRILNDEHGYKYINNRDEWFFYNMINTNKYFGCKITNM